MNQSNNKNAKILFIQYLLDLEKSFNINITIHDKTYVFSLPDGQSLIPERNIHRNEYCYYGRVKNRIWRNNCMNHCNKKVHEMLAEKMEPIDICCWKGVREIVIPIIRGNNYAGAFFVGAFKAEKFKHPEKEFPQKLIREYDKLPVLLPEWKNLLIRIISVAVHGLLSIVEKFPDNTFHGKKGNILEFVKKNAHQQVTLSHLAKSLHLSNSRVGHLVTELFGMSFKQLIMHERITRAKSLLLYSDRRIGEIASDTGFSDIYYFSRTFKKHSGLTPQKYRKSLNP